MRANCTVHARREQKRGGEKKKGKEWNGHSIAIGDWIAELISLGGPRFEPRSTLSN